MWPSWVPLPTDQRLFFSLLVGRKKIEITIIFCYPQISEVPSLARIVVVWNHQVNPPPHVESWPKIAKPLKVNFCPPTIIKNAERIS